MTIPSEILKGIPRSTFTVLKKNPKVHRRKENPTTKNSRSQHECFRIREVWRVKSIKSIKSIKSAKSHESRVTSQESRVKSAVVKTNSVFYSVLVVMWRQCDVAFLSAFILLLFLRIYQNLSTNFPSLFPLNITTQGVRHHSPLTTSLSLPFVRWTREGLPRAALSSLPYMDNGHWQSRLLFPGYFAYRSWPTYYVPTFDWSCYLLILTNLALYKR